MFNSQVAKALADAALQSYDTTNKTDVLETFSGEVAYAIVKKYGDDIIVAFRGTRPDHLKDWLKDIEADHVMFPYGIGRVHSGFLDTFNEIASKLHQYVSEHKNNKIYITGHSLGGALAVLFAGLLNTKNTVLYTFGKPRVGDEEFGFNLRNLEDYFRYVNGDDPVPHLPEGFGYEHFGDEEWFHSDTPFILCVEDHDMEKYCKLV